jgi:putative methyltransferase
MPEAPAVKAHQDNRLRPPRLYKAAASILRDYVQGKDSVKNLTFATKAVKFGGKARPKHPNTKALFALVSNAVNHKPQVDAATAKIGLFGLEPKLQQELAAILITELVWGKGELPGESLPVLTVLKYKKRIKKCVDKDAGPDGRALSESWPRWVL